MMVATYPGQTLGWVTLSPRVSMDLMDSAGSVVGWIKLNHLM